MAKYNYDGTNQNRSADPALFQRQYIVCDAAPILKQCQAGRSYLRLIDKLTKRFLIMKCELLRCIFMPTPQKLKVHIFDFLQVTMASDICDDISPRQ